MIKLVVSSDALESPEATDDMATASTPEPRPTPKETPAMPVRRVSLLDISDDIFALDDLLTEMGGELGSDTTEQTVDQWFAELGAERDRKIDGYGSLMAELTNRAEVRERRSAEMYELARLDRKKVEFLKARLLTFFQTHKIERIDTERFRFTRCTNGGHQPMWCEEASKLPEEFRRTIIEYKPESDKIRAALKTTPDGVLPFAKLLPRGEHIRIK